MRNPDTTFNRFNSERWIVLIGVAITASWLVIAALLRQTLGGAYKNLLGDMLTTILTQFAGLSAGVLYGLGERMWIRYKAKGG